MSKFRSSIFSFNTLKLKSIPTNWFFSIFIFILIFIAIEIFSRILLFPLGEFSWGYWDAEAINKFEWYRHLASSNKVPEVVAVGDSTGARDFYPKYFSGNTGVSSYNLAWPANFPLAFNATTLPLLENGARPKYVLLFQSPSSFIDKERVIRFENSILSSPIAQRYTNKYLVSDYIYLSRIYRARFLIKKYWIDKAEIISQPKNLGLMALSGKENKQKQENYENREEINTSNLSFQRLQSFLTIAKTLKIRGINLVVILPPYHNFIPETFEKYSYWLKSQAKTLNFLIWDYSNCDFLKDNHFWDPGHLNIDGAKIFSTEIGRRFKKTLLLNFRDRFKTITNLFFDKPTHCNAVSMMASKKAAAVFSQKAPNCFN